MQLSQGSRVHLIWARMRLEFGVVRPNIFLGRTGATENVSSIYIYIYIYIYCFLTKMCLPKINIIDFFCQSVAVFLSEKSGRHASRPKHTGADAQRHAFHARQKPPLAPTGSGATAALQYKIRKSPVYQPQQRDGTQWVSSLL